MPGQATVTIRDKQWTCQVASTPTEIAEGLSGVASIPAGTGMLFDLGAPVTYIAIDMSQMLFPLDIVFMSAGGIVAGVMVGVQPGEPGATFSSDPGIRYILEVNAGEATDVNIGDTATIQYEGAVADWMTIIGPLLVIGLMAAMVGMMVPAMKKGFS